jgi:hypothetical protein
MAHGVCRTKVKIPYESVRSAHILNEGLLVRFGYVTICQTVRPCSQQPPNYPRVQQSASHSDRAMKLAVVEENANQTSFPSPIQSGNILRSVQNKLGLPK